MKEECNRILRETKRGVLSILGEDDYPYGLPLNHFYDEESGRLYFHCGKVGYKIDCMKNHDKASYCVMDEGTPIENDWALLFKSVIVFGKVGFVEDEGEIRRVARLLSLKFYDDEEFIKADIEKDIKRTAMFYLEIEHMTGKSVTEK